MLKGSFVFAFLIISLLFSGSLSSSIFSSSPDVTFYTTSSGATEIKISPIGDKIAVGFNNGSIQIYTTKGSWYYSFYGHYSKIIDIEWDYASGLITLDSSGKAIIWSDSGSQLQVWQFNNTVYDMTLNGYNVAFSFANRIQQYSASSYYLKATYLPDNGYQFRKIKYDQYKNRIYAGYNSSYAQLFSTITNKSIGFPIYVYGTIQSFSTKGSQGKVVALASNNYLVEIDSYGSIIYLGSVTSSSRISVCSGYNSIALSQKYYLNVAIYDYNGFFIQNLAYFTTQSTGIDCDYYNLVTVDTYGFVTVNSGSGSKGWIIGLACGATFIFLCVVVIICIVKKNKKKNKLLMLNQYQNIDNGINKAPIQPINPPQPYFANQGYNNMGNQRYNNNNNYINPYNNNYVNPVHQGYSNNINNGYFANQNQNNFVSPSTNINNQGNNINPYNKGYTSNNIIIKNQEPINPYQNNVNKNWN